MAKKYVLAIAAFLAAANIAYAPMRSGIHFEPPKERGIIGESPLERYARGNEEKFLKSLYPTFPYSDELPKIIEHSRISRVEPELLMAIRLAENGEDSIAYGVLPSGKLMEEYQKDTGYIKEGKFYFYQDEKEKQLTWAAGTVKSYLDWFERNSRDKDFISYLAKRYAPINVRNHDDPNRNWERNVKYFYKEFKKSFE